MKGSHPPDYLLALDRQWKLTQMSLKEVRAKQKYSLICLIPNDELRGIFFYFIVLFLAAVFKVNAI